MSFNNKENASHVTANQSEEHLDTSALMLLSLIQPTVQHAHHKKIGERRDREGSKEEGQPKDKKTRNTQV